MAAEPGLPEVAKKPCNECPWRRDAESGFLGPHTSEQWATWAHGGGPIGCHKTIKTDNDWSQPTVRQCAGAAIFRANAGKVPQSGVAAGSPDRYRAFASSAEFLDHHDLSEALTDDGRLLAPLLVDQLCAAAGVPEAVNAELARWADDLGDERMVQVAMAALSVTFGQRMRRTQ